MWNRLFWLPTLALYSLAVGGNNIHGINSTTTTIASPRASGLNSSGYEAIPVLVIPITPAATAVNTSTNTPVGFTRSYTVPKSVETGLTALPSLDESTTTTTSADRSLQKTQGKSVIDTAETLPGIETSSTAKSVVSTAKTLGPISTEVPPETTEHGRVPTDTAVTKAKTHATTVDEDGTALSASSPTTTPPPPPGTDDVVTSTLTVSGELPKVTTIKTVNDDATALPVLTPNDAAPEETPSASGGNVVILPAPVSVPGDANNPPVVKIGANDATSLEDDATSSTVAKIVVDGATSLESPGKSAVVGETIFTVSRLTTIDGILSTAPLRTTAKFVVSQTGIGAPTYVQPGDMSEYSNTQGSGGNLGSYIACGLDKNCLETSAAQSQVVALPEPTQDSDSGATRGDDQEDIFGQQVTANAPSKDSVVYNSNTLSVDDAETTISGAKVTLARGGLVVEENINTAPATIATGPTSQAVALPAAAAYTYDAAESTFVYGLATLSAGGPAILADGHTISLAPSGGGVVVDAATLVPSGDLSVVVLSSDGGSSAYAYAPGASTLAYGSTTLSVGGSALTVDGKTVTLAPDGVLVDGSAVIPKLVATTTGGLGTFAYTPGASTFVYGSATLSVGGPDTTVAGQIISLAPGGVVVDGATVPASTRSPSPAAVITLGDEVRTLTKGTTLSLHGSAVLTLTPEAVATSSADGESESMSVGRNAVVIDGKTVTLGNMSSTMGTGTTRSGFATSRSTSTGASGSEESGSSAAATSTAGAEHSVEVRAAGAFVCVLGWIGGALAGF